MKSNRSLRLDKASLRYLGLSWAQNGSYISYIVTPSSTKPMINLTGTLKNVSDKNEAAWAQFNISLPIFDVQLIQNLHLVTSWWLLGTTLTRKCDQTFDTKLFLDSNSNAVVFLLPWLSHSLASETKLHHWGKSPKTKYTEQKVPNWEPKMLFQSIT